MEVVPGKWWQRLLAVIFGGGTAWLYLKGAANGIPGAVLWVSAIMFFFFVLLSIAPLYRKWMSFAEWLSVWVTRVLFSIIYLLFVPFIWILYVASGRGNGGRTTSKSFWIPKRKPDRSIEDLQRMG